MYLMKKMKKITVLLLSVIMTLGLVSPAFAVIGPVNVNWSNLSLSRDGTISFQMDLADNGIQLVPHYYEVSMDIMTNGGWRSNYRHFNINSSSFKVTEEINYTVVGIYKFRVTCHFVGGLVSVQSQDSDTCTVTADDIVPPTPDDRDHTGPGGGNYNPTSGGPGSSSSAPSASGKSQWYQNPTTKKWYYAATTGTWLKNTWYFINNNWYYFDNDCSMHTGWLSLGGYWYYLHPVEAPEGHRAAGFAKIDGKWYYFDPGTGIMQTGVVTVGGYIYCMDASGAMLMNEGTPDGHFYDGEGHRIR